VPPTADPIIDPPDESAPPAAGAGSPRRRSVVRATVRTTSRPLRRPVVPSGLDAGIDVERARLADYLKLLAWWLGRPPTPALPPRLEQTLRGLLGGQSEKEIARELGVSVHTVHEYVKDLHRRLGVNSRGELLARFLPNALQRR
jgi:DNA-binding CsgD family transcriptional regulator